MTDPARAEFERVALPYLHSVAFLAERLCGAGADAEDLAQETFLRALAAFDRFAPGTDLRKWLLTIALNAFRDRMRRKGRDLLSLDAAPLDPPAPPAAPSAVEAVDDPRLLRALDGLAPPARAVLTLCVIEGLSRKEAAEAMGCPEGTVRSLLSRAKSGLRRRFGAGEPGNSTR